MSAPEYRTDTPRSSGLGAVEVLAFACELALVGLMMVAGVRLGGSVASRVAWAVVLPLVVVLVWARWMAPTSRSRLADPARLVAQVVLFAAAAVGLAVAGLPVVGIVFGVVAIAVFALARRSSGVTGSTPS